MKKKFFILPVLSTVLLAPAFLAHQVSAEEAQASPEPAKAELTTKEFKKKQNGCPLFNTGKHPCVQLNY